MKEIIKIIKGWTTTKKMLILAVLAVIAYTAVVLIIGGNMDDTLTSEWYSFWKWTVVTGAGISGVKIIKKKEEEK